MFASTRMDQIMAAMKFGKGNGETAKKLAKSLSVRRELAVGMRCFVSSEVRYTSPHLMTYMIASCGPHGTDLLVGLVI
jgi:hypothetical protein